MVQLGIRQARYFGRTKTLFQAWMAATVANLTLIARRTGGMGAAKNARRAAALLLSGCRAVKSDFFRRRILRISL